MKKIRLNENDIENLVKKIIKEEQLELDFGGVNTKVIDSLNDDVRDIKIDNLRIGRYNISFDVSHSLLGIDVNKEKLKNSIEKVINDSDNYM